MDLNLQNFANKVNAISAAIIEAFDFTSFVNHRDINQQYSKQKSFTDFLPVVDYLEDEQVFLLEDYKSFACGIKFKTMNVDGFPESSKAIYRDKLLKTLNQVIPKHKVNPFVANVYFSNHYSLDDTIEKIKANGVNSPMKERFDSIMETHLKGIAKEEGIFTDTQITELPFSGKSTDGFIFLYRRGSPGSKSATPLDEIKLVRDKLLKSLSRLSSTFSANVMDGKSYYEWLFPFFNRSEKYSTSDLLKKYYYPKDTSQLYGRDISSLLTLSPPVSDVANGLWNFNNKPAKFYSVESIKESPEIGAFTSSEDKGSIFDAMPANVIMAMTIVFIDQQVVKDEIAFIKKKAVGDSAEATIASEDAELAEYRIARGNPILPIELGFYVFADSEMDLLVKEQAVNDAANEAGLQVMNSTYDFFACDTFLKFLPCNYRWAQNKVRQRTLKCTLEHVCNYLPVLGRGRGTGTPTQIQFNRGGEEMCFDILKDRMANSHMTMIGSTGAGKSAKLVEMFFSYLAQHNAIFFIIEKGDSFKRAVQYVEKYGVSTNSIKLDRTTKASIPPFANAIKALEQNLTADEIVTPTETIDELIESIDTGDFEDDVDDPKDYLGEMELLAKILVTGGDAKKAAEYGVVELSLIRKAIMIAAQKCKDENRKHPICSDIADALRVLSNSPDLSMNHKDTVSNMAQAMDYYCEGLAGHLFNREGELWKKADVTHIDLGDVVRDGKHAELAVAYASILNTIADLAEEGQYSGRPIIVLTDEAHNVVSKSSKASPILVPAIVKIVKMFRKINAWNWMATQNVSDFCEEAEAILKLNEWMLVLAVERSEDDDIAKLKKLTVEQRALMASVTSEKPKYSEGFVICRNKALTDQVFRNIPPSLVLVMGWSDPEEKKLLADIMKENDCDELTAVEIAANMIDKARGLVA
ncbi:MAG: conjugative transfer ATPase [Flavobacteriales bacterium]|jgi:conjugative transfer ATPase|nr:conjugative transfer ATPase [Flavobacteriales bacterium]